MSEIVVQEEKEVYEEKVIHTIISSKYIKKVNKYVVELAIIDEKKQTVWLTEKQMINLEICFDSVGEYSNKSSSVVSFWNKNGYYAFSKVVRHYKKHVFIEPKQHDLSDLLEVDI